MLPRRKSFLLSSLAVLVFVLIPFLFWHRSWFGRPLDNENLVGYLEQKEKPRQIQHALVQIAERITRGDPPVQHWYDKVSDLADHPLVEIRAMVAWVMGQEGTSEEFRQELRHLLQDREPLVRRNAALALVRFSDASGCDELVAMLHPYTLTAPREGTLSFTLREGDAVAKGELLGRVSSKSGEADDVLTPVSGRVKARLVAEGTRVARGDKIASLSPDPKHVWESLRALYIVGVKDDLKSIEFFISNPQFSQQIQEQAELTAEAIRQRENQ